MRTADPVTAVAALEHGARRAGPARGRSDPGSADDAKLIVRQHVAEPALQRMAGPAELGGRRVGAAASALALRLTVGPEGLVRQQHGVALGALRQQQVGGGMNAAAVRAEHVEQLVLAKRAAGKLLQRHPHHVASMAAVGVPGGKQHAVAAHVRPVAVQGRLGDRWLQ